MTNIQYRCTRNRHSLSDLLEYPIPINTVDIHCTNFANDQYPISMYKLDIHCTNLLDVQYPISMYKEQTFTVGPTGISNTDVHGRHSLYKPMQITNIQYRCTRQTFTVQTYANDQYPISMYKVDIHCTNLLECPISSINVQGRHSLYKPMRMTNMQHRYTRQKFPVNGQYPISKTHHRYSLYNQYVQYPISIIYLYCRLYFLFYFSN